MKRFAAGVFATLLLCGAGMAPLRAQQGEPTPPPDPLAFTDAAMNFRAPAGAIPIARTPIPLAQLSDTLQPVAAWAYHVGKEDARSIQLQMESYNGSTDQFEAEFETETHTSGDGILIRGKTPMTLLNGMPAYFVEVASGSGFDARKTYAIVWVDGQRGLVLSVSGRIGDISADEAKNELHDVTAVRYPIDQP